MKNKKEVQFEQPSEILIVVNRYIMLVLAVVVLLILGAGYWFLLKPKIVDIRSFEARVSQTQERKALNEALVLKIKELASEYNNIKENRRDDLDSLLKIIPTDPKIAEIFVMADLLAQNRGFKLTSIDISEKVEADTAGQSNVQEIDSETEATTGVVDTDVSVAKAPMKSLILRITIMNLVESNQSISGDSVITNDVYQNFKGYLTDVEDNIRLVDIQAINFAELSGGGDNSTFSFDMLTYYK